MVELQNKIIIKFRTEKEWYKISKLLSNHYNNFEYNYERFRDSYKEGDLQILIRNKMINGFGTTEDYNFIDYPPKEYLFIDIKNINPINSIIEIW